MNHTTTEAHAAVVGASQPRSKFVRTFLAICAGLLFVGFAALGTWQVQRLQWKLDLISRVDQRVSAPAVEVPAINQWSTVNAALDEYRHVQLQGTYLYRATSLVQASTELGSGYWVMTPLRQQSGDIVWINRGYIPTSMASQFLPEKNLAATSNAATSTATIVGLLRMSEPKGGFLRNNEPSSQRWFSRDIQALSDSHHLAQVAPFFVDQERSVKAANSVATDYPAAGLTVISFHNNHLVYALTWYALALMVAGAFVYVRRDDRRLRLQAMESKSR
ncbi:SURF1 family protein [Undibacterium sp. RuRC25W]|uniref:SURF1 family protein n=1 Tax=Undibacterium sp. RuRC25W TaxID=3413047 RepID=UPI003BF1504B